MKTLSILGSTGSIGQNTLNVARHLGKEKISIKALAAKSNIDLLEAQALEFSPEIVAVYEKGKALELQKRLPDIPVLGGMEGVKAVASYSKANFAVSAMTGTLGLLPTIAAIESGKDIGLANKEALVSGGSLVTSLAKKKNVQIIPIDSEHSAIFQCIQGNCLHSVNKLILTSSGGPFRSKSQSELETVSVQSALKHPSWSMGPKITIDSSTLMNKGLEVIEAYWLFNTPLDKIDVIVHPQSIIHSLVEFVDGSMLAQMSEPSMIVPIQYALTHPKRLPGLTKKFDFLKNGRLEFFEPDRKKFKALDLAYQAIREGGSFPCFMNGANEVLVQRFLDGEIRWIDIGTKLEKLMLAHQKQPVCSFDDIVLIDELSKRLAAEC